MATTLSLPPIAILASAAAELVEDTTDRALVNALNKAILHLHQGLDITPTSGGFLLPSGTRGGLVHRISTVHGCSCEAGQKQRQCWHAAVISIIEKAQTRAIPMGDRLAARRRALAEMDELYN